MLPWILNFMKGEYHNLSVNLSFNPIIFVVAGIFSAITVWVSIKKPFKIAATISPIEAYRGGLRPVPTGTTEAKPPMKRSGGLWPRKCERTRTMVEKGTAT